MTLDSPTLDILIPHFNDAEGLRLSLRSIREQTWAGKYRVVVADDASCRTCQLELRRIIEETPFEICLIPHGQNRGRPFMRNVLLDAVQSTHVAWLDAGDEWYPKKLEAQFQLLEAMSDGDGYHASWVTCSYDWSRVGRKTKRVAQDVGGDSIRKLLIGDHLRAYLWTLLGTAKSFKAVGRFDEALPRLQDLDYFIRFFLHGGSMYTVEPDQSLCIYHKSDIGRDARQVRSCSEYVFRKHEVLYQRYGPAFVGMRRFKMEMLAARFAQSNGQSLLSRYYLFRAARQKPVVAARHFVKHGLKV